MNRLSMNGSGVVFTGSSGNRLVDFCDHYLYFGRKKDAIYRQVDDSKVIVGEDRSENLFLMALRIGSWVIVIFPIIAAVVRRICVRNMDAGAEDLKTWKPIMLRDSLDAQRGVSGYFYECLEGSGITQVAYNNLYPFSVPAKSHAFFGEDAPYGGWQSENEKGPKNIVVVIAPFENEKMSLTHAQSESKLFGDTVVCFLSTQDSKIAYSLPTYPGKFSQGFEQVLTHLL